MKKIIHIIKLKIIISLLPTTEREIYILRKKGYNITEIAKQLNMTVSWINNLSMITQKRIIGL